jgi:hypothetical protein
MNEANHAYVASPDWVRRTDYNIDSSNHQISSSVSSTLIGQILLNHISEKGVHKPQLNRLINQIALWLDRRYPDGDDVINWMFLARRWEPESLR